MPANLNDVRAYYDRNTPLFLRYGSSTETRSIHRSLWLDGVRDLKEALAVSNTMVLEQARQLQVTNLRFADLGCGVWATMFHLLAGLDAPAKAIGLTLSSVQAHMADHARRDLGISNAFIVQGDFHNIPFRCDFHLIYSIEAFIHSQEPDRYFREVTRLLAPDGRLILLDDFLVSNADRSQTWVKYYQDGWYVPNPQTVEDVIGSARDLGLVLLESRDLTPFWRLRAFPEELAGMLYRIGKRLPQDHPIFPSMLGSMALQQCLKGGWIKYGWLVFEKP